MMNKSEKTALLQSASATDEIEGRSLWRDARIRLFRNKAAVGSMIILGIITLLAVFCPAA